MSKREVRTGDANSPGGAYSQGIVAGGLLYTAGFGPSESAGPSAGEQTASVLTNISAVLAAEGLTLDDVVKTTVHLQDVDRDFAEFNQVYASFFTEPYPVRTTVGSALKDILVEIDVVAKLRD